MTIEFIRHFYRATDPGKPLFAENPEDQKLYIDFSEVRGGQIIEELKDNITLFSPDSPTCSLFTGHIGCGKSTELLRLELELEQEGIGASLEAEGDGYIGYGIDNNAGIFPLARRISPVIGRGIIR